MARRCYGVGLIIVAMVPLVTGCKEVLQPCHTETEVLDFGWARQNGVDGAWRLVSIDGNQLPYQIPFSSLSPGGVKVAKGGGLSLDARYRYFADNCKSLRTEKGVAVASYRYSQQGVDQPRGTYAGTFEADHDNNTIVLGAAGKTQSVTIVRDQTGAATRILANVAVKKWGLEATFALVFERGEDFGWPSIVRP